MSFRLSDLKKHVRKAKDGHQVTPARLETRQHQFQVEFILQQFEQHLGQPRHTLDPDSLLHFIGDPRLGRGLLATLSQWYRVRPRTFPEVLGRDPKGQVCLQRLAEKGITGAIELRNWLFDSINRAGDGFLDPDGAELFWRLQARVLGVQPDGLRKLARLDRAEEAVLVGTGPRPEAQAVMTTYTARAHTTLLRSAREVTLRCAAAAGVIRSLAESWCRPLDVDWRQEGGALTLQGRADALGCWTRHGRRLERAALELLALADLRVTEMTGQLPISDRTCRFAWKGDTLAGLGAGTAAGVEERTPELIDTVAQTLHRERDRAGAEWSIRRPSHLIGSVGGVLFPHLELRLGDESTFVRVEAGEPGLVHRSFAGGTALVVVSPEELLWQVWTPEAGWNPCAPADFLAFLEEQELSGTVRKAA